MNIDDIDSLDVLFNTDSIEDDDDIELYPMQSIVRTSAWCYKRIAKLRKDGFLSEEVENQLREQASDKTSFTYWVFNNPSAYKELIEFYYKYSVKNDKRKAQGSVTIFKEIKDKLRLFKGIVKKKESDIQEDDIQNIKMLNLKIAKLEEFLRELDHNLSGNVQGKPETYSGIGAARSDYRRVIEHNLGSKPTSLTAKNKSNGFNKPTLYR